MGALLDNLQTTSNQPRNDEVRAKNEEVEVLKKKADKMLKKAIIDLNEKYISGVVDYMYENNPVLKEALEAAGNKMNTTYKTLGAKTDLSDFRTDLKKWYLIQRKMIEDYVKSCNE